MHLFAADDTTAIWAYRLPSVLAAVVAVFLTYAMAALIVAPQAAFIAAILLASCLLLTVEAHLAKADALVLASVLAAQYALLRTYLANEGPRTWMIFWLAVGAGVLVKGPITPLVTLLTAFSLVIVDRQMDWLTRLKPMIGLPLALAIVIPWIWAIQARTDGAFLQNSIGDDLVPKLLGGVESHGSPPGYYVILVLVTFWPASLFVWPALANGLRKRSETATKFLLAWLIPTWIIFEVVPTKLPHYVLPLYPALAILAASWIHQLTAQTRFADCSVMPLGSRIFALLWTIVGLTLAAAVMILAVAGTGTALDGIENSNIDTALHSILFGAKDVMGKQPLAFLAPSVAIATALFVFHAFVTARLHRAVTVSTVGGAIFLACLSQWTVPALDRAFLSTRITEAATAARAAPNSPLAAVGYHEPSLVFLAGSNIHLVSPEAAAKLLAKSPDAVVAVARRHHDEFVSAASALAISVVVRATIDGLNYSKGRRTTIQIVTKANQP